VVEGLERQATQITLLAGAVLNLARTTAAAVRSGENLPEGLQAAISDLTQGLSGLANNDTAAASRAMTRAVDRMVDPHIASPTSAPLIALLTLGCGRDLEHLVALSDSKPHGMTFRRRAQPATEGNFIAGGKRSTKRVLPTFCH
jgi:hypothetical protein